MLSTPLGIPASTKISTRRVAQAGVSSAGLKTTAFPHSSAGGRVDGGSDVLGRRALKDPDHIAAMRRIDALKGPALNSPTPLPAHVVVESLRHGRFSFIGHQLTADGYNTAPPPRRCSGPRRLRRPRR